MNPFIITSDEELRTFLPNIVSTVRGETPLYEKIHPWIAAAQDRIADLVTSQDIMRSAAACEAGTAPLRAILRPLLALTAFTAAIPALDLILTPSGFGVISSQNVVPASERRVAALRDSLLLDADSHIQRLLDLLRLSPQWRQTPQGRQWRATLFQDLADLRVAEPDRSGPLFDRYLAIRPRLADIEDSLAREWISQELLDELRAQTQSRDIPEYRRAVASEYRCCVARVYAGAPPDTGRLAQIVDRIRRDPDVFPEWHASPTSQLFVRRSFCNRKDSPAYFF